MGTASSDTSGHVSREPTEQWAYLAKYDSTYDCSGKNNTPAAGCLPMTPQFTLEACRDYCDRSNCSIFAFQAKEYARPNGTRGCWFRWGSDYSWLDAKSCPPPLAKGCKLST